MSKKRFARRDFLVAADAPTHVSPPDTKDLAACIDDARQAALNGDSGPADPTDFATLRARLEGARSKFPPLYKQEFVEPYIANLDKLGAAEFTNILVSDPTHEGQAGLMLDMAHAILQRAERFERPACDAFEEVVGDLYDGFLSAEDRQGINPPDEGSTPPLVKWGNPDFGPYTWPGDATSTFGARAAVVSLPPANARKGLLAWAALGHETGGHDILHADHGLQNQLASEVRQGILQIGGPLAEHLSEYWSSRIDETASDVMGILNMGPAAAIGLVGYFRALNLAFAGVAKLRNEGPVSDPHPADIVRGYLAAETVALLPFSQAGAWSKRVASETDQDAGTITLAGKVVSRAVARESARRAAIAIASSKVKSLENHALGEIQTWQDSDELKVNIVRQLLTTNGNLPEEEGNARIFATHIVAGAVIEALANGRDIPVIFDRMISILAKLHSKNPVWGPLFVRHPGNIRRDLAYRFHARPEIRAAEPEGELAA